MPMQPDELDPITCAALNLLGVALEAQHPEAATKARLVLDDLARLRRDLVQGAATAAYPRRAAFYVSLSAAAALIPGWEVLDEGKTYVVSGMSFEAFASEREAARFAQVVLEQLGKVVAPSPRLPGSTQNWL